MDLVIERYESPWQIESLRVASGFGSIVDSREVPPMFRRVLAAGGNVTAALLGGVLVGYAADLPFAPVEWDGGRIVRRWQAVPQARELGAVEVAAPFRNRGIAPSPAPDQQHPLVRGVAVAFELFEADAGNDAAITGGA
jgi:hypothetical protein